MATTAAGHAYTAALAPEMGDALLNEMEREMPDAARTLRPRIENNRRSLKGQGYVTACGLWSPHINGLAVPLWSPQYQTFVVVTIGLLSAMFDEKRLHKEVAPPMIELSVAVVPSPRSWMNTSVRGYALLNAIFVCAFTPPTKNGIVASVTMMSGTRS